MLPEDILPQADSWRELRITCNGWRGFFGRSETRHFVAVLRICYSVFHGQQLLIISHFSGGMISMKKLPLSAAAVLTLATPAATADMAVETPPLPPPVAADKWDRVYFGGQRG